MHVQLFVLYHVLYVYMFLHNFYYDLAVMKNGILNFQE